MFFFWGGGSGYLYMSYIRAPLPLVPILITLQGLDSPISCGQLRPRSVKFDLVNQ